MAKQKGVLKVEGTLDELTFYKTSDGHLVKTKSSVSKERIANDPNFQRTRENGSEFGRSATSGKLLRTALRNLMMTVKDRRVTSRLTQAMTRIKNFDASSARGERTVGIGIGEAGAKALLQGFDFNKDAALSGVLFAPFSVITATGEINFPHFNPMNDVVFPAGATHVSFTGAYANVDFVNGTSAIEYSDTSNFNLENSDTDFSLTPAAVPAGSGTPLYMLHIAFFQEINGVQYSLRNGAFNALNIVKVG